VLLALLCWLVPVAILRGMLALFTGALLLTGFLGYAVASWTGGGSPTNLHRYIRPVALFLLGWLLCCGYALTSVPVPQARTESPAPSLPSKAETPPSKLFPKGPIRFLSELEEFDVKAGPMPFRKNGDVGDGKPIIVGGVPSPHGLGMHPPRAPQYSAAKYRLEKEAAVFKGVVAINDPVTWHWSPAYFTVLGDGKELWKSGPIAFTFHRSQACAIKVTGVDVLELRVQAANGNNGTLAVWAEPRILQRPDTPDP
jgi:hypothetical protein